MILIDGDIDGFILLSRIYERYRRALPSLNTRWIMNIYVLIRGFVMMVAKSPQLHHKRMKVEDTATDIKLKERGRSIESLREKPQEKKLTNLWLCTAVIIKQNGPMDLELIRLHLISNANWLF